MFGKKHVLKNEVKEGADGSAAGAPKGDESFDSAKTAAAATDTGQPSPKPNNDDVSDVGSQVQS